MIEIIFDMQGKPIKLRACFIMLIIMIIRSGKQKGVMKIFRTLTLFQYSLMN